MNNLLNKTVLPAAAFTILLLVLMTGAVAQTADLSGTVTDLFGAPQENCTVTLAGYSLSTTTDAQGAYQLQGELVSAWSGGFQSSSFQWHDGRLTIHLARPERSMEVQIISAAGKVLYEKRFASLKTGRHVLDIMPSLKKVTAEGLVFVQVNLDDKIFRGKTLAGGMLNANSMLDRSEEAFLTKKNQFDDTLKAACPDGQTASKPMLVLLGTADLKVSPLWDIVVYGATSAGIIAGVQAVKMDKSVVIIDNMSHIGGLTTGGLGETDIGNKQAIGGLSLDFYERVAQKYSDDAYWTQQTRDSFNRYNSQSMWVFEPKVAMEIYNDLIEENGLQIVRGERLDLDAGVVKEGTGIRRIVMESGTGVPGRMFIDATYEGDLMAGAGVSYTVGRESNSTYNEQLNGIQTGRATKNQLVSGIDPYVTPGDPSSGLIFGVNADAGGSDGQGDEKVQAYCFRMTLTNAPENRLAVEQPEGYDESVYEVIFRAIELGTRTFFKFSAMPNRKTDSNNQGGASTDFMGQNYLYPDGTYAERDAIVQAHEVYQKGLLWTLTNHPRVPESVRNNIGNWGLPKDEFTDNGNWTPQLYIREARRMIGEMVMTESHVRQNIAITKSVGMGAYTMDSHNVQRHVGSNGYVRNEGDVQVGGFGPYPIDMGSILPKKEEADNLIVPVCLSASHMAFGSIRMEPVFMILGQSASTMASHALDEGTAPHDIDYPKLYNRLVVDGQKLGVGAPTGGLTLDNNAAELTGNWTSSSSVPSSIGGNYIHDGNTGKGSKTALFTITVEDAGTYEIFFYYTADPNRATNVPVSLNGGTAVTVNQQTDAPQGVSLGEATLTAGGSATVLISNTGTDGYVVVDGVKAVKK